ncbi:peptidoglycan DD-metalloendopeptidase family protein [Rhodovibrionaceae bacterium A322]
MAEQNRSGQGQGSGTGTQQTSANSSGSIRPSASRPWQVVDGIYQVQSGDTLYGISRGLNVPLRSLIDANGLEPPYRLRVGQRLVTPTQRSHLVVADDTIYGIARRYNVDRSELVRLNQLQAPYTISVGQLLLLPESNPAARFVATGDQANQQQVQLLGQTDQTTQPASASASSSAQQQAAPLAAPAGPKPTPAPTSSSTTSTSVTAQQLAARTNAQEVMLGGKVVSLAPAAPRPQGNSPVLTGRSDSRVALASTSNGTGSASGTGKAQLSGPLPKPPARSSTRFAWPVNGSILTPYGPQAGKLHNDGINITAPKGTPILAAENGVVAYVGDGLRGFGNLLLVKHADGWVSAYAHADSLSVKRGQVVRRGQPIGRVGRSGSVSRPQLHFELRKGTRAMDPLRLLEKSAG